MEGQELTLKTDLFEQGMVRVIFETDYYLLLPDVKPLCCTKLLVLKIIQIEENISHLVNFQQNFQKKNVGRPDKMDFF